MSRKEVTWCWYFPLAFTSVCTAELCSIRDSIGQYNSANAKVYGISVDSPQTLAKFKEEQRLNFPITLVTLTRRCTVWLYLRRFYRLDEGVSKRSAFVIDKYGVVQYAEVLENAGEVPDFEAINKTLAGLN